MAEASLGHLSAGTTLPGHILKVARSPGRVPPIAAAGQIRKLPGPQLPAKDRFLPFLIQLKPEPEPEAQPTSATSSRGFIEPVEGSVPRLAGSRRRPSSPARGHAAV